MGAGKRGSLRNGGNSNPWSFLDHLLFVSPVVGGGLVVGGHAELLTACKRLVIVLLDNLCLRVEEISGGKIRKRDGSESP